MAIVQAATLVVSAAIEAAGLVWMELAMFAAAAMVYVFFVGIPGLMIAKKHKKVDLEAGKSSPRGTAALAAWDRAKSAPETLASIDLLGVVQAMRQVGKTPQEVAHELKAAVESDEHMVKAVAALPAPLLRDDSVDVLDAVLELLEGLGQDVDAPIYQGLMAAQLRRRLFSRVAATGRRVPQHALTPRMRTILASAAAQSGDAAESLQHVGQMSPPEDGDKSPLVGLVALQILGLAAREDRIAEAVAEMQRLQVHIDDKQFSEFQASHGRRFTAAAAEALAAAAVQLGVSGEAAGSATRAVAAGRAAGLGSGQQRAAGMIKSHAKEGNFEAAAALFDRLRSSGDSLSPLIHNCFLDACVQCGKFDRAEEQFREMKRMEVLDTVGYNTVLKAHLTRGRTEDARTLVNEMKERGFSANVVTYNELLHSKVLAKDRRGMWALVDEMQKSDVKPSAATCSIVLKSLAASGHVADLSRAVDLIDRLEESVDDVLFSSLAEACVRTQQLGLLTDILARFRQRKTCVTLSAPTYGFMIKAYGQAGQVKRVQELWTEMQAQGVKPTSITLGCLTEALVVNNKAQEAWDLVREQMVSDEMRGHINTVIYSTVLKGFAVAKDMDKTFAVYDEMRGHGIACNTITYNTIFDACAKACGMKRASALLHDMAATGVEPDIITYSTILKGYCVEGDVNRAFHIMEEMKKDGKFKPDEIMYNSIIDGCAKQHRTDDALRLLAEMQASGIAPSNYTLSILVKVLGHARRLNQAFEMVDTLSKQNGFRPNVQVYTCLVQACVHNRRLDRALALHDKMVADAGVFVDEKFYGVLVKGCLQMRQPLKAVDVVRAAYKLPNHSLAQSSRKDGRPAGVDSRTMQELAARLQGGREEQQAWSRLSSELDAAGMRLPSGGQHGRGGRGQ